MHNIALTWQQGALLCAALAALGMAVHLSGRIPVLVPVARESAIIAGLYALWQLAGTLSVLGTSGAYARARWLQRTERSVGFPSEAAVQRAVDRHPLVIQACNVYYATMHFGVMFAFLLWLFLRHRDRYAAVRTTLALTTLACLLIQLVPVAPPRLLPGYVDTARQYGQSVYSLGVAADQLSAMPSVHVAWAVLVGWVVVRVGRGRWRWLAVVHPVATLFVITATANHFWADGVVAVAVLVACAAGQRATGSMWRRWRAQRVPASAELAGVAG